ncbi:myeloid-derived growth factor-like [Lethenteron reissneri]|uniref:myeloid-derived growth factor-like n=1 Tax=Lethenteron reissneri TaxID=7753 RepID=UPI002AB702DD|nr:myeloid-derived growth factor-like [Lethenteron reissneri]
MSLTNKTTTTMRAWAACLTLAALFVAASADEKALTVEFDVRPGGIVHSFKQELGKFGCTFTYAAQGGTNEQWLMSLGSNEDQSLFSCSVWRPNGKSYLFFVQFNTEISGAKVEFAEAFSQAATINLKDIALKPSEIVVGEHTVSHNPGQFGSQLSKLMIVSRKPHEEL